MNLNWMKPQPPPPPPTPARPALRLVVHAEAFSGFGNVRGFLLFDGTELRFDFETADSMLGVLRSGPRQVRVPLTAIERVRCGLGFCWLAPYIEIALNDFALVNQVPGSHDGGWRLRTRFANRHLLRRFTDALTFRRAEEEHASLERSLPSSVYLETPPVPDATVGLGRKRELE